MQFLDWFVKEQGEEEATASDLIQKNGTFRHRCQGPLPAGSGIGARVYAAPDLVL